MKSFYITALVVFLFDRLTKYLVLQADYKILEITPFLNLVKVWNKGIAFGFFRESPDIFNFLLILLIPLILLAVFFFAKRVSGVDRVSLSLIFGGGLGNWLDRIALGAVLDFIDIHVRNYHWPAFNIADASISLGLILFLFNHVLKDIRK
ncbi:MAG: signal peptidase II [Caldimicrobium sp.]|nr:signal peptidase II [Caldimicrobium sp.]MCX7613930.1 signal peptidase II [Caldimicrobium sp.]MDW8182013.1 signal peptidase II [Caldimicrobium sp.]